MTSRALSKGSLASLGMEWAKPGVPVWYEVRDEKGIEIYEFLPAIIKEIVPVRAIAHVVFTNDNSEKDVPILSLHQRNLEPNLVNDLTEIPILNDAELLTHFHLLYQNNEIYCYCGPSLIAINPYKNVAHTTSPETMNLIKTKLRKGVLNEAPPHVWTVSAQAFKSMESSENNQAICINGESGAGKTESTKKCLQFLTQLQHETNNAHVGDLADQILACNPILEAFGNSKTLRNDNSSRFGKYVKLFFNPEQNFSILGATMDNYLLEKSRVVSITKDERGFHIFYAVCRFMPIQQQRQYFLSLGGEPCDMRRFKILRSSGLYETPKINDKEFYADVVNAFSMLGFSDEEEDAIWRIISIVLHMGNFEVDSSNYEEGKRPCSIVDNDDFKIVVKLLNCDPQSLQEALTLRIRQVQNQVIRTPHRPENVIDFFLAMAKDLYNNLFNWIVKKLNVVLASSFATFPKKHKLKTVGLLDIFGFEIFNKNYIEQLFINYANERLQGLYIDHIFKNECQIFKNEGLDKYVALITYKDNIGLVKTLDSNTPPPGIFPLTNQICRLNQKDESLMGELRKAHGKPVPNQESYISFHKIKQNLFYIRHTAREVEYTIDGFVEKSKDEISMGIVKTIEASHQPITRIYKGIVGSQQMTEDNAQINPNAKFLSYKFCMNMDQLMDELHKSACHFIRCVKPNEAKKPDNWVGYLVLKQITYMGLLDSLKVRKYNYPIRFRHAEFYRRYQDIDANKEGSISYGVLEANNENFRKLTENLLGSVGIPWSEKDLLLGKTRIFINEPFKYKLDEILKIKQKAKRDSLAIIAEYYKNQVKRKQVASYIKGISRSIQLARNTLANINAKIEYVRFKGQMKSLRKFQRNFRTVQGYRQKALQYNKAKFIAKVCKLKLIANLASKVLKIKRALEFVRAKLLLKVYRNRQKHCKRIVESIINKTWNDIKSRFAEKSANEIQRHFRAFVLRKKHKDSIAILNEKVKNQIVNSSTNLIQAHIKGYLVRSRFRKLQMAARVIQGYFRSKWLRDYYLKLRTATIKIQKNFRKFFWKNSIIATKLQEFVDSSHNIRQFALREYESLLGNLPYEVKATENVDYEFQKWSKKLVTADPVYQKFLPSSPEIELTPKAKLFAIPFDLTVTSETLEAYPGTLAGELKSFLKKIGDKGERLLHVIPGDSSTFCVTDDLRVYSFGANDYGQLCSEDSNKLFFGRTREVYNLTKNPMLQVSLGRDVGASITQSGRVFFWGKYTENQMGLKSKRPIDGLFIQNGIKEEIVGVSVRGATGDKGEELTYVVGKSGNVYVLGANSDDIITSAVSNFQKSNPNGKGSLHFSEAERDFKYKEIQRKHHQSITTVVDDPTQDKSSKVHYRILEIEEDTFAESTRQIRKKSPLANKTNGKLNDQTQMNLVREIDPYKKIVFVSSGIDFSMFLSDKGVLFALGENTYGELGLGDELSRNKPVPINLLRRANEKVDEVSCGLKHVVCRTNLGKIYSWGMGSNHQNGNLRSRNILSPTEIQFTDSKISSITKIRNVAAGAFASYFFFEDGSLFMLGKCGPGTFSYPSRIPYNTRMFMGKMKEEFVPVKLFVNWSSMYSIGYLVFLDFRDVDNAKTYKEKIAGIVASKWRMGNILPAFDENLHKYIQSKNLLRDKPVPLLIDLRYSGTSDGRPKSVKHVNINDDLSDRYSINQHDQEINGNGKKPATKGSMTINGKSPHGSKSQALQMQNQLLKTLEEDQKSEHELLSKRLEELNHLNKANAQKAKVGRPPVIAPPLKGYKEEPLKAKVFKVDKQDRIVSAQSISIPQRVYHKVTTKVSSKSPEKKSKVQIEEENPFKKELSPGQPSVVNAPRMSRSKSKSQPKLNSIMNVVHSNRQSAINVAKESKKPTEKNILTDINQSRNQSPSKSPKAPNQPRKSSLIRHPSTKFKHESIFDMPPEPEFDLDSEGFSKVMVQQKSQVRSTFLERSGHIRQSEVLEKKSSPFVMASDGPKSRPATNGLNPALKRGATPKNHTPNVNNTFLNFNNESGTYIPSIKPKPSQALIKMDTIDLKSKDELFSQMSSKKDVSINRPSKGKSDVKAAKQSTKEPEPKAKPSLHESIFTEVEKIMKKDPSKWNNIEREIINSYVKLTKSLTR
jgi:myosin heavy subunit/alpha-tubulin suppressor-like RCC1 family protein